MKKEVSKISLIFFLFFLSSLSFNCNKEKDDQEGLFIGLWEVSWFNEINYEDGVCTSNETFYEASVDQFLIEFLEDHTGACYTFGAVDSTFIWAIIKDGLLMDFNTESRSNSYNFYENNLNLDLTYTKEWTSEQHNYKYVETKGLIRQ